LASSTAKPLVVVVTGTSGAGKGTLEKVLLERMPDLELAVSATTRDQRPGEVNGREYWFITPEKFERLGEDGEFLEYVDLPWGARSGTLRSEIDRIQAHGRVPLLDLETDGALRVQEDEFLEYVDLPWGARSGTLRSEIDRIQANGKVPLLDLETDGAIRVKETIAGARGAGDYDDQRSTGGRGQSTRSAGGPRGLPPSSTG